MDVFDLRDVLIDDYEQYVTSFMKLRDDRISELVQDNLKAGRLWPDPSIGLNPTFATGGRIDDLVAEGLLHEGCRDIFRTNKDSDRHRGDAIKLHKHQRDAIERAGAGRSFVLTTGTGSGKSLSYIIPAVDHVLRSDSGQGIRALIVYPMNALANSQLEELNKFLGPSAKSPVTYARYTGQETEEQRHEIRRNPPDILLTNYVMLELLLTHSRDEMLVRAMRNLRFLVLDELHTYRGRQGADVAFLCRRLREASKAQNLLAVGTSATMSTEGSLSDQQSNVAKVASTIFGMTVEPADVIGETLRRATPELDQANLQVKDALTHAVRQGPAAVRVDHHEFISSPMSSWIESTFGLDMQENRLVRREPIPLRGSDGGASRLARITGEPLINCELVIKAQLLAGYQAIDPETGFPAFAFRLHQFISRGDTVYASPEPEENRHITLDKQRFVPGDRNRVLLPLAFCRSCGQEYYIVAREDEPAGSGRRVVPRDLGEGQASATGGFDPGFVYISSEVPWPDEEAEVQERLPDDWIENTSDGSTRIKRDFRDRLPVRIGVRSDGGLETSAADGVTTAWWTSTPFRFCLRCGVSYAPRRGDFGKLTTLGSEGRSTATTVLSLSAVRHLRSDDTLEQQARKLLSFTDNRQDASLQAGHFNDFVQVALLRGALLRAVRKAGPRGLEHHQVPQAVFDALDLPFGDYAIDPDLEFAARRNTEKTLRDVLAHRVYLDLRRGWRLTSPNLEQCGLLTIDYESLDELAGTERIWAEGHPALADATAQEREEVCRVLLDFCRKELAIKTEHLNQTELDKLVARSNQSLIGMWELEDNDPQHASSIVPRPRRGGDYGGHTYLSARGGFGRFLRRTGTFARYSEKLNLAETEKIIATLFAGLQKAHLLEKVGEQKDGTGIFQVPAAAMLWKAGDGSKAYHDVIRMPSIPDDDIKPNPYFINIYRDMAEKLLGLEAREHSAQVPYEQREKREERFRMADLPVLYCSPTMELGVDISQLNVVNMRNVPPTPANYAQRSGRAGRSGQPALVFTYCSAGSPHDQYFFRRPQLMVAGQVSTPRLELANESLVRSHVHAIWLAASGLELGSSLTDVIDVKHPDLPLQSSIQASLEDPSSRSTTYRRARQVLDDVQEQLRLAPWWTDDWLNQVINDIPNRFREACERWRTLYRSALRQFEHQNSVIGDVSRNTRDKHEARRLRAEAEKQQELLTSSETRATYSDFYSYRYFASEGFLPGYNFPRLPLAAFIPGRRGRYDEQEYLNRPRFLAISEFGPRTLIYHEGARYRINRVILPVAEGDDGMATVTSRVKHCQECGYMHPIPEPPGPDVCERCDTELPGMLTSMFRMQNVSTRRTDKISSDEEERQRVGFELQSGVRFTTRNNRLSATEADVIVNDEPWARLTYGDTATIWRINLGWRRRQDPALKGFVLDLERGTWESNKDHADDPGDPMSRRTERVIPYVEDTRNALLLKPREALTQEQMASLGAALKHSIQRVFQL